MEYCILMQTAFVHCKNDFESLKLLQTAFVHHENHVEMPQNYCRQHLYIAKMTSNH